jgi:hypothetical protein
VRPPVKRPYDASRRRQAAERTHAAILDAARQLFSARGYAATPMTAIAERAGVARDTVAVQLSWASSRAATRACPMNWP